MKSFINFRTMRAVLGALAVTLLTAACSDAPSGLRGPAPTPYAESPVTLGITDLGMRLDAPLAVGAGERVMVRSLRDKQGSLWKLEASIGVDGMPRALKATRDGRTILNSTAEWRMTPTGYQLAQQRGVGRAADGSVRAFDSRPYGGLAALMSPTASTIPFAPKPEITASTAGTVTLGGSRLRRIDDGSVICESQMKAFDAAFEAYIGSVLAYGSALLTGNPIAIVGAAWGVYTSFKNFDSAGMAVLECLKASAAPKPEDEY